eukprot:1709976-Rhodomonas_salina.1
MVLAAFGCVLRGHALGIPPSGHQCPRGHGAQESAHSGVVQGPDAGKRPGSHWHAWEEVALG